MEGIFAFFSNLLFSIFTFFGKLNKIIIYAISLFDNPDLALYISYGIIGSAAIVALVITYRYHRPYTYRLSNLTKSLKDLQARRDLNQEQRLEEARTIFKKSPAGIHILWKEYDRHLKPDSVGGGYQNLIDPRVWFSLESIPGRGYEHWSNTWAGIFLTVGLLFTFIGLSAALLKVVDISGADSAAMEAAITGILNVSAAKFITSIAGIFSYIVFSLLTRFYISAQHKVVAEFADAIQHLSIPLTPEYQLYKQEETSRKQLDRLDCFTDDLAVAIDNKLKERMEGLNLHMLGIQQALPRDTSTPIVQAIEDLSNRISSAHQEGLKEMLKSFSAHLQSTGQGEMKALLEQLNAVARELMNVQGGMRGAGAEFGNDIRTAASELRNAAQEMQKSAAAGSGAINEQIAIFSKNLVQISQILGETPKQIDQALHQTLLKLTDAIDQLVLRIIHGNEAAQEEFNKDMNDAGNVFGDRVDESSTRLAAAVARLEEILRHFSAQLAQVEKSLDRLPGAVAAQVSQLEQASGSFARASEGVLGAAQSMNEAARPVAQANVLLKQSVEQANTLLKQSVEQANALLKQSVDQVQKSVQESAGQQAVLREAIGSMLSQLQNATQAAERTFIRHAERFGEVDVAMERAIMQLRDGVEEITRTLGSTLGQYDEHIHNAMSSLQGAIEDLAEAVEDIPKHSSSPARRP